MDIMESKKFVYIENFQAVVLNQTKANQIVNSRKQKSKKINHFFKESQKTSQEVSNQENL